MHPQRVRPRASEHSSPLRARTHTQTRTHTHIPREHRPLVSLRVDRCAGGVLHALRASGHAPWPHRAAAASRARRRRAGAPPRAHERAPSTPTSLAWSEYGDGRWSGLAARSQRHCRCSRHVRVMWRVCTLEPSSWSLAGDPPSVRLPPPQAAPRASHPTLTHPSSRRESLCIGVLASCPHPTPRRRAPEISPPRARAEGRSLRAGGRCLRIWSAPVRDSANGRRERVPRVSHARR